MTRLPSQDAETEWLAQHKDAINEKIGLGIAQLDRGEGVSGDVARAPLLQRKTDWLKDNNA